MISGWCVYLLRDEAGHVRYVGKGTLSRGANSSRAKRMAVEVAAVNLTEREAFDIESRLINLIGPERLLNEQVPVWPGHRVETRTSHRMKSPPVVGDRRAKLDPDAVRHIRSCDTGLAESRALAARYGVSLDAIRGVQHRITWRQV